MDYFITITKVAYTILITYMLIYLTAFMIDITPDIIDSIIVLIDYIKGLSHKKDEK